MHRAPGPPPVIAPTPVVAHHAHRRPEPAPRTSAPEGLEAEIALKWLGRIGALALIVAAAFFLQYAFANHWIGPLGQVILGVMVGVLLLCLGEANRTKGRPALAEAMMGGGIALFYVCVYAAYALYRPPLLDQFPAFVLMGVVTAVGVALAVRADALSMAVIATIGGFLTPLLVRSHGTGPGDGYGTMVNLFGYLLVLDVGLLALGLFKRWRALQMLSLVATWLVVWGWMADGPQGPVEQAALGPMAGLFLIFALMPAIYGWWRRTPADEFDMALILANPVAFFPTVGVVLSELHSHLLGACAVAVAAFYFIFTGAAWRINRSDNLLTLTWLSLGATFVTVAVPLQFDGLWVLLAWGLEGALLIAIGLYLSSVAVRSIGAVLQGVVAVWLLLAIFLYEHSLGPGATPFLNRVFLSCVGGALTLLATYLIYAYTPPADRPDEAAQARGALVFWLSLLALALPTMESIRAHLDGRNMFVWWALCGPALVSLVLASKEAKAAARLGLVVACVVAFWTLRLWSLYHGVGAPTFLCNTNFALFLLGLLSVGSLYALAGRKEVEDLLGAPGLRAVLPPILAVMGLWGTTAEISHSVGSVATGHAARGFLVSMLWCVYASGLVAVGMWRRYATGRQMGVGLFGIAILKVFLVDAMGLGGIWRVLSFVTLGAILLGVSYLYNVYRERVREFMRGEEDHAAPPPPETGEPPDDGAAYRP